MKKKISMVYRNIKNDGIDKYYMIDNTRMIIEYLTPSAKEMNSYLINSLSFANYKEHFESNHNV